MLNVLEHGHLVVQVSMGWQDYHLHQLEIAGVTYGVDDGEGWGPTPKDERRTGLDSVAGKGTRFTFEYDFGDGWEHDILVEDVLDADAGAVPGLRRRRAVMPARGLRWRLGL